MNTTTLKTASERSGLVVASAGVAMLAVALVTSTATHGGITAAPPPSHATTTPATAPPASTTRTAPTRTHTTAPAPRTQPTGDQIVAASEPRAGSSSPHKPNGSAPSGPAPHPTAPQQPATQCSVSLAVAALNACLKLGGNR